jgi:hypothetical protein
MIAATDEVAPIPCILLRERIGTMSMSTARIDVGGFFSRTGEQLGKREGRWCEIEIEIERLRD